MGQIELLALFLKRFEAQNAGFVAVFHDFMAIRCYEWSREP